MLPESRELEQDFHEQAGKVIVSYRACEAKERPIDPEVHTYIHRDMRILHIHTCIA